jgi:hypothetical protein
VSLTLCVEALHFLILRELKSSTEDGGAAAPASQDRPENAMTGALEWLTPNLMKRPNPLGLKCDTITSPRRLVNTFIHQMIIDLFKRYKPIKVANNFKSWSTTQDISSEWG